jgi:hypothetical protein
MKKILGILVLGLLLSGNAYAKRYIAVYKNYFDMELSKGNTEKVYDGIYSHFMGKKSLEISKKKH